MAQKIAPAALRLRLNKHFDALWYSDRLYDVVLHHTLHTKLFVHTVLRKLGAKTALSHVQATSHAIFIQSFFCNPRTMNQRMTRTVVPVPVHMHALTRFAAFVSPQPTSSVQAFHAMCVASHGTTWKHMLPHGSLHACLAMHHARAHKQYALSMHSTAHMCYAVAKSRQAITRTSAVPNMHKRGPVRMRAYAWHVESVFTRYFQKRVVWQPYKVTRIFTSATFVAHYIALQIEQHRKKPLRFIFQDVLKECMRTRTLVGIRIAVAGCIGNVDKARVDTVKYGQTSLHVFAHRIDYHATTASTRKGLLGIKVWMSFK